MSLVYAPNSLRPADGAIVFWTDYCNVSAVKLDEISDCTDSIHCAWYKLCFHHHYKAEYDRSQYGCHLWEFLDLRSLSGTTISRRQNELAALISYYRQNHASNSASSCLACDISTWLNFRECPVCNAGMPADWSFCMACIIAKRMVVCNHANSLTTVVSNSARKRARLCAPIRCDATFFGGSPAQESIHTLQRANHLTPGSKTVRRALQLAYGEDSTDSPPAHDSPGLRLPTAPEIRQSDMAICAKLQTIIDQNEIIIRKLDTLAIPSVRPHADGFQDISPDLTEPEPEPENNGNHVSSERSNAAPSTSGDIDNHTILLSPTTLTTIFTKANSRTDLCLKLFRKLFSQEEMLGRNCNGSRGKDGLDRDELLALKTVVFDKMPPTAGETHKSAWHLCVRAIDCFLLRLNKKSPNDQPDVSALAGTSREEADTASEADSIVIRL